MNKLFGFIPCSQSTSNIVATVVVGLGLARVIIKIATGFDYETWIIDGVKGMLGFSKE